jgi:hypothetical protein
LEERLKGPTGGEVDVDATSRLTDACTDFEQLSAQSFDLSGSQRHGQLQTKQIDEVVGETVKQQPKGIGSKAMAAESIGIETILELFNAVLALPAIVIEAKDRATSTFQVGDQKAQVGTGLGVFGFVADAALMEPALSTVRETRKKALRLSSAVITTSEPALSTNDATLKDRVGRHADGVLDAEKLAELIEQRQSKARIGT